MSIGKAILAVILFFIFLSILSLWPFIGEVFNTTIHLKFHPFINGLLELTAIYIFIKSAKTSDTFLQPTQFKWYLIAFLCGVLFILVQTPLNMVYNLVFSTDFRIIYDFNGMHKFTHLNILGSVLFVPIAEELFFREYLQRGLHKKYAPWLAVGIASLLFSLIHLPFLEWAFGLSNKGGLQAFKVFFGSLVLGTIYYKSGSIGSPVVMHIAWNTAAELV